MNFLPRVKSEYLVDQPFLRTEDKRKQWSPSFFLITRLPLMPHTQLEAGLEQSFKWELRAAEDELVDLQAEGVETGDFGETIFAVQTTNTTNYLGYKLVTQLGFLYERRSLEVVKKRAVTGAEDVFELGDRMATGFHHLYHDLRRPLAEG